MYLEAQRKDETFGNVSRPQTIDRWRIEVREEKRKSSEEVAIHTEYGISYHIFGARPRQWVLGWGLDHTAVASKEFFDQGTPQEENP